MIFGLPWEGNQKKADRYLQLLKKNFTLHPYSQPPKVIDRYLRRRQGVSSKLSKIAL